jgi:hypothetical protein
VDHFGPERISPKERFQRSCREQAIVFLVGQPLSAAPQTRLSPGLYWSLHRALKQIGADRKPAMKWPDHPNLRNRPHSPNLGRGRLQRMARRAFRVGGAELSTTVILDWAYARHRHVTLSPGLYWSLHRALKQIGAERVGRVPPYGAVLWRLRDPENR